jgi:hypothetical protein
MLAALQQLVGTFPRRFLFNALLPTFVFVTVIAVVLTGSTATFAAVSRWWSTLDALSKVGAALGYASLTWFLAAAVSSQWRGIVRLFEGYPLWTACRASGRDAPGVRWHQQRLDALRPLRVKGLTLEEAEQAASSPSAGSRGGVSGNSTSAYYRYPTRQHRDRILPTRLGNILLAGESYSTDRYGIDCIIFWPRLWPLLPDQFKRDYEEFLINYEFPLVVSFLAAVTSLISGVVLILTRQSPWVFLAVFLGGFAVSYGAYCFSLTSAEEIAEQQRTAFDLYRDRLLEGWPTVLDVRDEKIAFDLIRGFVVDNRDASWGRSQAAHHRRHRIVAATDSQPGGAGSP